MANEALSPEEQIELEELRALDAQEAPPTPAEPSPVQGDLSPEEAAELQELRSLEANEVAKKKAEASLPPSISAPVQEIAKKSFKSISHWYQNFSTEARAKMEAEVRLINLPPSSPEAKLEQEKLLRLAEAQVALPSVGTAIVASRAAVKNLWQKLSPGGISKEAVKSAAIFGLKGAGLGAVATFGQKAFSEEVDPLDQSVAQLNSAIAANPDKFESSLINIQTLMETHPREAFSELARLSSFSTLEADPVKRNIGDVLAKKNEILTLLEAENPLAADALRAALIRNDVQTIGGIMSSSSQLPAAKSIIEPGIGWEGRVTNEMEASLVRGQIESARMPAWQKRDLIAALDTDGSIPTEAAQPFFQKQSVIKPRTLSGKKLGDF